jgi:hypothetical protein
MWKCFMAFENVNEVRGFRSLPNTATMAGDEIALPSVHGSLPNDPITSDAEPS